MAKVRHTDPKTVCNNCKIRMCDICGIADEDRRAHRPIPSEDDYNAGMAEPLVRCNLANTCSEQCGGKDPHRASDCEPCPFRASAKCVPITSEVEPSP
jgi:hypothetical protein